MEPKSTRPVPSDRPEDDGAFTRQVLDRLRNAGGRVTGPRRAVVETLIAIGDTHLTAEELVEQVRIDHPNVHRATVYRTLEKLQDAGIVTHVHLGHGPSTFHLGYRRHHHAVCSSCGASVELPLDTLDEAARHLRDEYGWELGHQHFALSAQCRDCRGRAPDAQTPPPISQRVTAS